MTFPDAITVSEDVLQRAGDLATNELINRHGFTVVDESGKRIVQNDVYAMLAAAMPMIVDALMAAIVDDFTAYLASEYGVMILPDAEGNEAHLPLDDLDTLEIGYVVEGYRRLRPLGFGFDYMRTD